MSNTTHKQAFKDFYSLFRRAQKAGSEFYRCNANTPDDERTRLHQASEESNDALTAIWRGDYAEAAYYAWNYDAEESVMCRFWSVRQWRMSKDNYSYLADDDDEWLA